MIKNTITFHVTLIATLICATLAQSHPHDLDKDAALLAVQSCLAILKDNPDDLEIHFTLAENAIIAGLLDDAQRELEYVFKADPEKYKTAKVKLAEVELFRKNYEVALEILSNVDDPDARMSYERAVMESRIYLEMREYEKALAAAERAVGINEKNGLKDAQCYLWLSLAKKYAGKSDEAVQLFLRSLVMGITTNYDWIRNMLIKHFDPKEQLLILIGLYRALPADSPAIPSVIRDIHTISPDIKIELKGTAKQKPVAEKHDITTEELPPAAEPDPPGQCERRKCPQGMCFIPPGEFVMGCSPGDSYCKVQENPPTQIKMTKGFCMDEREVMLGEYLEVVGEHHEYFKECGTDCPAAGVTWKNAKLYCEKTGKRLPTEAEWEYAARGGSTGRFYGNVDQRIVAKFNATGLDAIAWYSGNSGVDWKGDACPDPARSQYESEYCGPHPVGLKQANGFGLRDMLGNVWEWTRDCYAPVWYSRMPHENPMNAEFGCEKRVLRGGSWKRGVYDLRVSNRDRLASDSTLDIVGFRCAAD